MRIRKLKINNFRGIKELDWNIPNSNVICLIGKGDSSKSTILDAIQYVFYPQWNLSLVDSDFYQCTTDNAIVIEATIGDLTADFCSFGKYGHHLRGWDADTQKLSDEPDDHLENVLTVQLKIEKDLEPNWSVITDRNPDGVEFKTAYRTKVGVSVIGAYSERQLSWGTGTALAKLTDTQNINESLANATRTARSSLDSNRGDLVNFDNAANQAETVAKVLGVPVTDTYKAHLDLSSINIKIGGLTLHDGDMPLRLLGLGSRRMLLCGIQKNQLEDGHITLFDEVEFGLEPHRIARLIKHIKEDTTGQYFLTTHSPSVLRELTIAELHIVHSKTGIVEVISAVTTEIEKQFQRKIKLNSNAEAFLAKKIIVCEGITEVGFLRGFDDYQVRNSKNPFSYHGVALLDAGSGNQVELMAKIFHALRYDVSVLADADDNTQFSKKQIENLKKLGVKVNIWSDECSIEQRAMIDLPWNQVLASVKLALELNTENSQQLVYDKVFQKIATPLDKDIDKWKESPELRIAIGNSAKDKSGWFKDIIKSELWFNNIYPAFADTEFKKTDLYLKLTELWTWVEHE